MYIKLTGDPEIDRKMMEQMDAVQQSWYSCIDQAWRSPELRSLFEEQTGMSPLSDDESDSIIERETGYTSRYHGAFVKWATIHLGIVERAPVALFGRGNRQAR